MFDEIKSRANDLSKRYGISLKSLSDNQVLEIRSDKKLLNTEFNEILNIITELVKETPSNYDSEYKILETACKIRDNLRAKKDNYTEGLEKEIQNRDLDSNKMKNASLLKIELPKFKDYNSTMDIYTFQK